MAYTPTTFVNGTAPGISATELNKIGAGISTVADAVDALVASEGVADGLAKLDADGDVVNAAGEKVTGSTDASTLTGTQVLDSVAPGTQFIVATTDGTTWKYAGSTVTARPSSRTDLTMIVVNSHDSAVPAWALDGDILWKVA